MTFSRSRHWLLPLTLILNLCLNIAFLAYTGTIRLPLLSKDANPAIVNDGPLDYVLADQGHHVEPATTPVEPQTQALAVPVEPVVFAMVMYGSRSATEGLLALKSAFMYVSRPVEFHIICSPNAVPIIRNKLQLFSRYAL